MLPDTVSVERRKHERYSIASPVLIMGKRLVGIIKDIGCGGCSFQYAEKQPGLSKDSPSSLELLDMAKIEVQTVEDRGPGRCFAEKPLRMRVRRVKFINLTRMQTRRLQHFLHSSMVALHPEK